MTSPVTPGGVETVAVVVPAYNAGATIDATLRSVRGQTYRALDIIVVDDGSTDATAAIVERHARRDARIRMLAQPNGGVARARNRGIRASDALLVAPLDADDLWHPETIARQVEALERASPSVGLVYTWSATLDRSGCVVGLHQRATATGDVVRPLLRTNVLENASCTLFRRSAFDQAGGYEPALRDADAQGCEDWLFYLAVARHWHFAVVPAFLTGYRVLPGTMSSHPLPMWRSQRKVAEWARTVWPEHEADILAAEQAMTAWLFARAVLGGKAAAAASLFQILWQENPRYARLTLARLPREGVRTIVNPVFRRRGWFIPPWNEPGALPPGVAWGSPFPLPDVAGDGPV